MIMSHVILLKQVHKTITFLYIQCVKPSDAKDCTA